MIHSMLLIHFSLCCEYSILFRNKLQYPRVIFTIGILLTRTAIFSRDSIGSLVMSKKNRVIDNTFENVLILFVGKVEFKNLFGFCISTVFGQIETSAHLCKANLSSSIFIVSASKWKVSQQPDSTGLRLSQSSFWRIPRIKGRCFSCLAIASSFHCVAFSSSFSVRNGVKPATALENRSLNQYLSMSNKMTRCPAV